MADQISLLENIRDELKSNNKKAVEEAATAEKGILTQKQLLKVQQELKKSQEKDSKNLAAANKMMESSMSKEGKDKAGEVIKRIEEKMANESQSIKNQENMMQKAAEVRGVSVETFKEMRGKLEQSD